MTGVAPPAGVSGQQMPMYQPPNQPVMYPPNQPNNYPQPSSQPMNYPQPLHLPQHQLHAQQMNYPQMPPSLPEMASQPLPAPFVSNQPMYPPNHGPTYAQPAPSVLNVGPPAQNQHVSNFVEGVHPAPRETWSHSLCDCCENSSYCCYVCFCGPCAIGELHAALTGNARVFVKVMWLLISVQVGEVILRAFSPFLGGLASILATYVWGKQAFDGVKGIAYRMNITRERNAQIDCACCCKYTFCLYCAVCQAGRELERGDAVELVTNMNRANTCVCKSNIH